MRRSRFLRSQKLPSLTGDAYLHILRDRATCNFICKYRRTFVRRGKKNSLTFYLPLAITTLLFLKARGNIFSRTNETEKRLMNHADGLWKWGCRDGPWKWFFWSYQHVPIWLCSWLISVSEIHHLTCPSWSTPYGLYLLSLKCSLSV